jgi:hypothetical protein
MTAPPPRDVRADAARAFARRLNHEQGIANADLLARELLVLLDSHQIGLIDLRRPSNPDADPFTRPTPAPPDSDGINAYRAARAAQAQKDQP